MNGSPFKKKSGFVCIIGRPNVGKSTFLNCVLKQKVSIISEVPQTTRYTIRGIYTDSRGQIVFVDTPGFYKPEHNLGTYFVKAFHFSQEDADAVLYMVDVTRRPGQEEMMIMQKVVHSEKPVIMVLNKIDKGTGAQKDYIKFWERVTEKAGKNPLRYFIPASALEAKNTDKVLKVLFECLPEGEYLYPEETVTDFPQKFLIADIIREKLYSFLKEEIPHAIGVTIESIEDEKDIVRIQAVIYVERSGQKSVVIGKKGQVLKEAGTMARKDLEAMFKKKVYLGLWIKVKQDWRNKPALLREMGFYF